MGNWKRRPEMNVETREIFGEEEVNYVKNLLVQIPELCRSEMKDLESVTAWTERRRSQFIAHSKMHAPKVLRMIDCKSTVERRTVVVVDWHAESYNGIPYTAVSHTFGMEVYKVFDCACASEFIGMHQTSKPRANGESCPGHTTSADGDNPYVRVVQDILGMCQVLWEKAGAQYVWHDGVCIAQHDEQEVEESIKHMGWIYSTAKDTIVFLHYVGAPMPPISHDPLRPVSRWHTRVWTIQETALSQRRRYCIRMGSADLFQSNSFEDLERELASWHDESASQVVIVDEGEFRILVVQLAELLARLMNDFLSKAQGMAPPDLACMWVICIHSIIGRLRMACTLFPTLETALELCGLSDSKHKGDRINSITALAGLKNFAVPKDGDLELSTIEFFKSIGQAGLATALFICNLEEHRRPQPWKHSWVPDLTTPLASCDIRRPEAFLDLATLRTEEGSRAVNMAIQSDLVGIKIEVLPSPHGNLELTGLWGIIKVQFSWFRNNEPTNNSMNSTGAIVLMDVYEENSAYKAFLSGFNRADKLLGWMVASRRNRVEEPFRTALLAFPAFKIVTYVPRATETIMERLEDIMQGPRAVLLAPIQDTTDGVYQSVGRFFITCHLRRMLATSLQSSLTICHRLVIV